MTEQPRKGRYAVAGVTAAALLLGGGVLAAWEATETVTPGSVTSGEMRLDEIDSSWEWATDGSAFDPATEALVPGDEVIYRESVQLTVTAPGMVGTMTTTLDDVVAETIDDDELATAIREAAAFEVDGVTYDGGAREVTHADNGSVLDVALHVTLPADAAAAMAQTVDLGDVHVTLSQGAGTDTGDNPGDGEDGELSPWEMYQAAEQDIADARSLLRTVQNIAMSDSGTPLREQLTDPDFYYDPAEYQPQFEAAGIMDMTPIQAISQIEADILAIEQRRGDALDAMHATGDSLTARWVTETSSTVERETSKEGSTVQISIDPTGSATQWKRDYAGPPFSIEWDTDTVEYPGVDVSSGHLSWTTPTEPTTVTFGWTMTERSSTGDLIAETHFTQTVNVIPAGKLTDADGNVFYYPNYAGANLAGTGIDLWGSGWSGANFEGAIMPEDLYSAGLEDANLRNADFTHTTDWSYARLYGADLTGARVDGVPITEAFLLAQEGVEFDWSTTLN